MAFDELFDSKGRAVRALVGNESEDGSGAWHALVTDSNGYLKAKIQSIGADLTWSVAQTGMTLTSPTINGTIATTGLTMPAFTLGGLVAGGNQGITNLDYITFNGGTALSSTADNLQLSILGGTSLVGGASINLYGDTHGSSSLIIFTTTDDISSYITRLIITGHVATAVATWSSITHTGIVLSGALDVAGQYLTFLERAAPGAGAANEARMYAIVDGGDLTDMAVVFQDGTVDIFAQETTPLDSPIFTQPSQTEFKMVMEKPHPGLIKFVAKYPDGKTFTLKEIQYHHPTKIAANIGAEGLLPKDWLIENTEQIATRLEAERLTIEELGREIA